MIPLHEERSVPLHAVPILAVPHPGRRGPQFLVVCDRCGMGVLMAAGKSRQRALELATKRGFNITGDKGAETVLCPACAKPKTAD